VGTRRQRKSVLEWAKQPEVNGQHQHGGEANDPNAEKRRTGTTEMPLSPSDHEDRGTKGN
jgi:hypothetical protein